ncbi:MAG: HAD-IA family hydrolase [Pleurocapsa sp. MO_192.B19]|nr:HAD-IA family hydrolase [Pleurocapsa sp. MO_192.B19]
MSTQSSTNTRPKVIFLDAMGTLFDLKSSVGEIYQQFALKYGVKTDAALLDKAFINAFKASPPLAFPGIELETITKQEFIWWKNVIQNTFFQAQLLNNFSNFADFSRELYTYFATKEPWYVFPDVLPCLENWQRQGIELGVISNFDSRLYQILKALDLAQFFTSVTISSVAGFAKPEQNIFEIALKKHQLISQKSWHIGDSFIEDYQGAKNAGIRSFWLNRSSFSLNNENQLPNLSSLG